MMRRVIQGMDCANKDLIARCVPLNSPVDAIIPTQPFQSAPCSEDTLSTGPSTRSRCAAEFLTNSGHLMCRRPVHEGHKTVNVAALQLFVSAHSYRGEISIRSLLRLDSTGVLELSKQLNDLRGALN